MKEKDSNMPDFLLIGAGKCGTTSLHHYLQQHPQVFMSSVKEPNFFALENSEDIKAEDDVQQFYHYPWAVKDLDNYKKLFAPAQREQQKGEASTMYLYMPEAPYRIKHYVPNIKLVAIFRQPAERLYSRYLHLAREDRLPSNDFKDTLNRNSVWWQRNDLIKEGFYYTHLSRYFSVFPKENIRVYLYEDLNGNPIKMVQDIYHFLNIDRNFRPDLSQRLNQSGFIKNRVIDNWIGQKSILKNVMRKNFPRLYENARNNLLLQKQLNSLRVKNLNRPELEMELAQRITKEIYEEDILMLQDLINRDLSHWIKKYDA